MKDVLISREYLKKLIDSACSWPSETDGIAHAIYTWANKIVDECPPVDLKAELISQRSTGKTGLPFFERPKGEWKPFVYDYDIGGDHTRPPREGEGTHWEEYWAEEYKCSICGAKNHKTDFCPWCGADMRKEGQL